MGGGREVSGIHLCKKCKGVIWPWSGHDVFIYMAPFSHKIKNANICSGCLKSVNEELDEFGKAMESQEVK